ncbi:thionin-like protein 2 [Ricinus communis]|uniref:Thionin-like protein 2 n=1 Tax=Ricinus communis TaxID=3988 RepID=B9SQB8_RICCO|nr:thionin-like protein 2 [Ricinus communis]EEF34194.1 conserved hypothetical protein [Ricinus communis]|eukprot:XP_025014739.1 thionin-like protein 2 [Ricinus communis]
MEERRAKAFMVVLLVFSLLVGQSYAAFSECYKECFLICLIISGGCLDSCAFKCLKDCILPLPATSSSLDDKQQIHDFCKLGCASSLCTNLSSKNDPGEKKVGSCVDSCSNRCT